MTTIQEQLKTVQPASTPPARPQAGPKMPSPCWPFPKLFQLEAVQAAYDAGQTAFGENYIQEAQQNHRVAPLAAGVALHRPDPEQQTRLVAEHFDWVHTVDRLKIAQRLMEQRSHPPPLQVCIQAGTIDGNWTKSCGAR